ncbi:hypothetical protein Sp245p_03390 [Azospirillum baldaniorum]|uniref:hypothetical protein n=1 Tax=Azospirillum baldaniorum TaxID=1064539 RepID=UPI0005A105BA|nr:hypothetical protein [Azospirillum baldaniorum]AWJ88898.1 hypothetical protein Sp245p_03390 [Azospirillum baldaniorum]
MSLYRIENFVSQRLANRADWKDAVDAAWKWHPAIEEVSAAADYALDGTARSWGHTTWRPHSSRFWKDPSQLWLGVWAEHHRAGLA